MEIIFSSKEGNSKGTFDAACRHGLRHGPRENVRFVTMCVFFFFCAYTMDWIELDSNCLSPTYTTSYLDLAHPLHRNSTPLRIRCELLSSSSSPSHPFFYNSLIGCVWSKAFKKTYDCLKIFVVCPVSLKTEWQRTAENATGLQVEDDSTAKSATANKSSLDMKICSWAKVVTHVESSVGHYVVVCDEAHSMQSIQASRTKDVLKLVKGER
jgi:hypothetical protein